MYLLFLIIIYLSGCTSSKSNEIITWGHEYIGVSNEEADKNVKVAILDSGIFSEHEDLEGKIFEKYNAIGDIADITDNYGHGINIAGILAANKNSV
ncbi:S8 family serine peptidase [Saliterribacillus persicus]|uniref:Subtilase family protein n=1 Tax=Saliterribacillus persicus TaxID=930114 RepID=A0A368X8Q1_9BACI|nr:S8 family serine peptidase [Saliterribacillus persicus]RCW63368.1 subtilase family protein [Saliterribacillus persicus]